LWDGKWLLELHSSFANTCFLGKFWGVHYLDLPSGFQLAPPFIPADPVSCPITWNLPEAALKPRWMVHLYLDGTATWMRCGSHLGVIDAVIHT
jgi:hypothetical protein